MSHRSIEAKQRHKVAKAFRVTPPRYFDLVDWLVAHKHASTKTKARKLILDKKVRSGSHVLGVRRMKIDVPVLPWLIKTEEKDVVRPHVPVSLRGKIEVLA